MQNSAGQSEFEIIKRHFLNSALDFQKKGIELGIGDDAALLDVPADKLLAMSLDVLVSDIHFPSSADPFLIANRALAVNLSDLAAMAAEPFCFTLGLVLPFSDEVWLQKFSEGLLPLALHHNCPLVGGDISKGPLSISIQVQGLCDKSRAIRRKGARAGDKIYVSGTLGDGAIALRAMGLESHLGEQFDLCVETPSSVCQHFFEDAYFKPNPRIELSLAAAGLLSSCIDISDGLCGDLSHILDASEVAAELTLAQIPYSASARCCVNDENRLLAALYGGDDYELCFTVPAKSGKALELIANELGAAITCIGEIVDGRGISCIGSDGAPRKLPSFSYQHFNLAVTD